MINEQVFINTPLKFEKGVKIYPPTVKEVITQSYFPIFRKLLMSSQEDIEDDIEEKKKIAAYAAALIRPEDFVYLDAGTTTGYMLEHLEGSGATFVTNGVSHARALAQMGVRVLLIGGELKGSTEAVIGSQAMQMLKNYHFTKGFFGTNGMTQREGFTTPESNEALVKRTAMEQCLEKYVVSDSSKFGQISAVTFFSFDGAVILTESCSKEYKDCRNIQIVS
mgnify:CR=1 FL=1